MKNRRLAVLSVVIGLLVAPLVLAHHAATQYETDKLITLKGTVTEFRFVNPHPHLYFQVKDEAGTVSEWIAESGAPPSEKELNMARMLIDALAGPFEPERFTDEHRERVLKAIEQKKPIESPAAAPSPTRVLDLMAALEASVKAAKAARAKEDRQQTRPERKRKRG